MIPNYVDWLIDLDYYYYYYCRGDCWRCIGVQASSDGDRYREIHGDGRIMN